MQVTPKHPLTMSGDRNDSVSKRNSLPEQEQVIADKALSVLGTSPKAEMDKSDDFTSRHRRDGKRNSAELYVGNALVEMDLYLEGGEFAPTKNVLINKIYDVFVKIMSGALPTDLACKFFMKMEDLCSCDGFTFQRENFLNPKLTQESKVMPQPLVMSKSVENIPVDFSLNGGYSGGYPVWM